MVKESARKCSQCGRNGHNSRSCNGKYVKLFGVNVFGVEKRSESIRKSRSTGDMADHRLLEMDLVRDDGYSSDGVLVRDRTCVSLERKKGISWNDEEHLAFLAGLEKLGKGDWNGISKKFVPSRTPTQVASHAQKYFIRQAANDKTKRRLSVFDMTFKEPASTSQVLPSNKPVGMPTQACNPPQTVNQKISVVTAACGAPKYHGTPHMAGIPCNGQSIPSAIVVAPMSLVPATSYPMSGILCQDNSGTLLLLQQYGPPIWFPVTKGTS